MSDHDIRSDISYVGLLHPLSFFFFNDAAPSEIYTLSLHDALPICAGVPEKSGGAEVIRCVPRLDGRGYSDPVAAPIKADRKSTRLNSSHANISYAVFCLKKKKHHLTFSTTEDSGTMVILIRPP